MSEHAVKAIELAGNVAATDLSLIGLFEHADIVVKLVMIMLFLASFWTWAIIFEKLLKFRMIVQKTAQFEKLFWSGQLMEQLYERLKSRADHPLANIFVTTMHEWHRSNLHKNFGNHHITPSTQERISKVMELVCNRELEQLEKNLNFLDMVASYSPFVGLFGTVWGIMHSFQSIAASKNTTLVVVAPGIAEALLATAIGLIAAIPAAIFYNILVTKLNNLANKMEDYSGELSILLFREHEEGKKI